MRTGFLAISSFAVILLLSAQCSMATSVNISTCSDNIFYQNNTDFYLTQNASGSPYYRCVAFEGHNNTFDMMGHYFIGYHAIDGAIEIDGQNNTVFNGGIRGTGDGFNIGITIDSSANGTKVYNMDINVTGNYTPFAEYDLWLSRYAHYYTVCQSNFNTVYNSTPIPNDSLVTNGLCHFPSDFCSGLNQSQLNLYVKDNCTDAYGYYEDVCVPELSNRALSQVYCYEDYYCLSTGDICPYGYVCSGGVCVTSTTTTTPSCPYPCPSPEYEQRPYPDCSCFCPNFCTLGYVNESENCTCKPTVIDTGSWQNNPVQMFADITNGLISLVSYLIVPLVIILLALGFSTVIIMIAKRGVR